MPTWTAGNSKAACDARTARLNNGYIKIYTAGFATLLATLRYGATAFGAATSAVPSVATANAITRDPGAAAGGTAAAFRAYQSDGTTLEFSGTVTATGGGGDFELISTTIAAGEPVECSAHTLSQP